MLRRFSTNLVDVVFPSGLYVRAFAGAAGPTLVGVRQADPTTLALTVQGSVPGEEERWCAVARHMLGTERRTPQFERGARELPWLRDLARRMRGVRPPRYPTLWEACVNAVVFQQVSLVAASAILRRTIVALGDPVAFAEGRTDNELTRALAAPGAPALHVFPGPQTLLAASDATLRAAGLSSGKVATLRRVADALLEGQLDEAMLEERTSLDASALLCSVKGIGPWTAAVVLLRGLGRLDVFPQNDSGVARSLAAFAGGPVDVAAALEMLGSERGLLYYHLLLARLEARGEVATSDS